MLLAPLLPVSLDRAEVCSGTGLWDIALVERQLVEIHGPIERRSRVLPREERAAFHPRREENVVNKDNYMINRDTTKDIPTEQWVQCGLPAFHKITMPAPTADGIHRLMEMDLVKNGKGQLKVLNMSEMTPLARGDPLFQLERNSRLPLWYHLGVGMFNRQADSLEARIGANYYDLVLFEYVPGLNNFYPFRVRDSLRQNYRQVDSFMAPAEAPVEVLGTIEVYVR